MWQRDLCYKKVHLGFELGSAVFLLLKVKMHLVQHFFPAIYHQKSHEKHEQSMPHPAIVTICHFFSTPFSGCFFPPSLLLHESYYFTSKIKTFPHLT